MRDESVTIENGTSLVAAIVLPDNCIDYVGEHDETTPGESGKWADPWLTLIEHKHEQDFILNKGVT